MTDLDRDSLDRILPDTPGSADWDDVMSRFHASRSGPRRRRLVMLAAAALVAIVGTASAIGGVRDLVLDRGFIGLPPEGATPSAPESGELVLRWRGSQRNPHETRLERTIRPAPGRRLGLRRRPNDLVAGWAGSRGCERVHVRLLEQRLTPEGVELLRSEVVGLLDRSRALLETVPPDDDPRPDPFDGLFLFVPNEGSGASAWGSVEVRDGDRFVRLQWSGAPEGTIRDAGAAFGSPADRRAAHRPGVGAAVERLGRSRGQGVRAVALRRVHHTSPPKDASHLLSLLPARAADLLRDKSRTRWRAGHVLLQAGDRGGS